MFHRTSEVTVEDLATQLESTRISADAPRAQQSQVRWNIEEDRQKRAVLMVLPSRKEYDKAKWRSCVDLALASFMQWNAKQAQVTDWTATVAFGRAARSNHFHMKINMSNAAYFASVGSEIKRRDETWAQHNYFRQPSPSLITVDDSHAGFRISRSATNVQSALVFSGSKPKPSNAADLTQELFLAETAALCISIEEWAAEQSLTGYWITAFSPESMMTSGASQSFFVMVDLKDEDYCRLCSVSVDDLGRKWSSNSKSRQGRKYIRGQPRKM